MRTAVDGGSGFLMNISRGINSIFANYILWVGTFQDMPEILVCNRQDQEIPFFPAVLQRSIINNRNDDPRNIDNCDRAYE